MGLLKNTSSKANSKLNTYKKDEPGLSVSGAQPKPKLILLPPSHRVPFNLARSSLTITLTGKWMTVIRKEGTGKLHFLQQSFQGIRDRHFVAKVSFRAARSMADCSPSQPRI